MMDKVQKNNFTYYFMFVIAAGKVKMKIWILSLA
jgi:hypothetical protein